MILPRSRGWHLDEAHILVDGAPVVAALVDFGLYYFFHNAAELLRQGSGPYFYLPKMESHLEARLWKVVFVRAQEQLGIPIGTIRATVLIETIPAAFEMDEILYELRDHVRGLNAGRWDYLFSIIKTLRDAPGDFTLPERNAVTMDAPMMKSYSDLLVKTCHRRGGFAMGGMAAFIPSRRDPEINAAAFAKVREDKAREVAAGFDGSWVAHPDLVPLCAGIFDEALGAAANQVDRQRDDVSVTAKELLAMAETPGSRTEQGVPTSGSASSTSPPGWAATARCDRQPDGGRRDRRDLEVPDLAVGAPGLQLESGETVTSELVEQVVAEESARLFEGAGDTGNLETARSLFLQSALDDDFVDFLTLPAYDALLRVERPAAEH